MQVLQEVDGDVDAAIEFLIAEQDMDLHENADSSNDRPKEKDLVQGNELSVAACSWTWCNNIFKFFYEFVTYDYLILASNALVWHC